MSYTLTPQKQYNQYQKPEFAKFLQALEKEILEKYDGKFQCRLKGANYDSVTWPHEYSLSSPFDYQTYSFMLSKVSGTPIEGSEPMYIDSWANRLHVVSLNIKSSEEDLKALRFLAMIPHSDFSFWSMSKDDDLKASKFCMEAISGHRMNNSKYNIPIYRVKSDPYLENRLKTQAEKARLTQIAFNMSEYELQQATGLQGKTKPEMLDSLISDINYGKVNSLTMSRTKLDTDEISKREPKAEKTKS
jgi:hypothetical protein